MSTVRLPALDEVEDLVAIVWHLPSQTGLAACILMPSSFQLARVLESGRQRRLVPLLSLYISTGTAFASHAASANGKGEWKNQKFLFCITNRKAK